MNDNRVYILLLIVIVLVTIFHLFVFMFVLGCGGRIEYVERVIKEVEIREIEAPDELILIRYLDSLIIKINLISKEYGKKKKEN